MAINNINIYGGYTENPNSPVFDAFASRVLPMPAFLKPRQAIILGAGSSATLANRLLVLRDGAVGVAGMREVIVAYNKLVPGSVYYGSAAQAVLGQYTLTATDLAQNGSNKDQVASVMFYQMSGRDIEYYKNSYAGFGATKALRSADLLAQINADLRSPFTAAQTSPEVITLTEKTVGSFAQVKAENGFVKAVTVTGSTEEGTGKVARLIGIPKAGDYAEATAFNSVIMQCEYPITITGYGLQEIGTGSNLAQGYETGYVVIYATGTDGNAALASLKTILQGQLADTKQYLGVAAVPA